MRWIWIDRFLEFQSGKSARAVKNLSLAEDHFADHFPGYPVMPAALILEGLAQTGGILVGEANDFREKVVLAKIPKARLPPRGAGRRAAGLRGRDAAPAAGRGVGAAAAVLVGRRAVVAEAEIFFAHLDQARSQQLFGDHNFVFSGELKYLLGLVKVRQSAKDEGRGRTAWRRRSCSWHLQRLMAGVSWLPPPAGPSSPASASSPRSAWTRPPSGSRSAKAGAASAPSRPSTPPRCPSASPARSPISTPRTTSTRRIASSLKVMARTIQLAVAAAQLALDDCGVDKAKLDPDALRRRVRRRPDRQRAGGAGRRRPGQRQLPAGRPIDLEKWGEQACRPSRRCGCSSTCPTCWPVTSRSCTTPRGRTTAITESDVGQPAGPGRGVPHPGARPGRLLPGRRRREQDQPAEPGAAVPVRAAVAPQRRPGEGVPAVRPRPRRPRDRRGRRRAGAGGAGTRPQARRPHLRRGGRLRRGLRPRPQAATAWRGPCGPPWPRPAIGPEDVDHVNAHGLASREADVWEARGFAGGVRRLPSRVPVFAAKSYLGNLGAGGGTTELAASVLALQHGVVPATLNYEEPDPECPVAVTAGRTAGARGPTC